MSGRQRLERSDEIPNLGIGGADADSSAEVLQHVDACPTVWRVHHDVHHAIRCEHAAEGAQTCIRIRQVVKDSCADNLIEARLQFVRPLDGKLVDLKISQVVFSFELFDAAYAGFAELG